MISHQAFRHLTGTRPGERAAALAMALIVSACGGAAGPPASASPADPPVTSPPASATVATNALVFNGQQSGNFEIHTIAKGGTTSTALTNDPAYDSWWPRISPDRKRILFYRTPAGSADDYAQSALWVMDADGANAHELIANQQYGWTIQGHAEWSPDGQKLVMCGTADNAVHVFVTDAAGSNPQRKTIDGTWNCDPAFSPDGQQIIFNRCTTAGPCTDPVTKPDLEIYLMPATGAGVSASAMTRLTNNTLADYDAYFSPDGNTIAWLQLVSPSAWNGVGAWAVQAMDSNGSNPRAVINDGFINSKPAWSLDSSTIYLHRLDGSSNGKWGLFSVAANGSNLQRIAPMEAVNLEFPSN